MDKEKKEPKKEIKPLISIYLKDGKIEHSYSEDNSEIIEENNYLLHGFLGKIQQELLNIDLEDEDFT